MNEKVVRAFIAVDLQQEAVEFIRGIVRDKKNLFSGIKWVDPARVHLTLHFFPEFPESQIPGLHHELISLAESIQPFSMKLEGMGVFPSPQRARVLWLGIDPVASQELGAISSRLENGLAGLGFDREERPFRAHVTLGRFRIPQAIDPKRIELAGSSTSDVNRLVLYQSTLTPQGPIYRELAGAGLGEGSRFERQAVRGLGI